MKSFPSWPCAIAIVFSAALIAAGLLYNGNHPPATPPSSFAVSPLTQLPTPPVPKPQVPVGYTHEKVTGPVATLGALSAYSAEWDGTPVVVLERAGTKQAIAAAIRSDVRQSYFADVAFSPLGDYLSYAELQYEGEPDVSVYDLKNNRVVLTTHNGTFNPNETLYFDCVFDHFSGDYEARIYSVPRFTVETDLLGTHYVPSNAYQSMDCMKDVAHNLYQFTFYALPGWETYASGSGLIVRETYTFNLTTGKLESVK